ncbi:MAG: hypothetical protein JWQ66_3146, partial [Mucilaginibacter sp.]|nr:hypothetical protein [Mucilaginibacter sp.]
MKVPERNVCAPKNKKDKSIIKKGRN